jgi:monoamine oxidase
MNLYDFVIIGGGISGLYTAYSILYRFPTKRIIVLEKETRFGGRIHSFKNKYMEVESGAGRFHKKHVLLIELIKHLNLENKIIPISNHSQFIDCKNQKKSNMNNIFHELINQSKSFTKQQLINISFCDLLFTILKKREAIYFIESFGFSTEITTMNSYDAIILIKILFDDHFFILKGGLSQIIDSLLIKLTKMKCRIINNSNVKNIDHNELTSIFKITYNSNSKSNYLFTKQCICSIPVSNLNKLSIFHSITPIINKSIYCGSLCRIYSVFPLDKNGKVWFQGLTKFTTQNNLRMVIPINEKMGVIMISYTDGEYAKYWKNIYDKYGIQNMENQIKDLLFNCLKINIPSPIYTKMFYWDCGVGYWTKNTNSSLVSQKIYHPFSNKKLFICGEHYSTKHQQWMEGALETSKIVTDLIFKK